MPSSNSAGGLLTSSASPARPLPPPCLRHLLAVDVEQLRRALLEAGFTEAAAMVEADIESQRLDAEEEAES